MLAGLNPYEFWIPVRANDTFQHWKGYFVNVELEMLTPDYFTGKFDRVFPDAEFDLYTEDNDFWKINESNTVRDAVYACRQFFGIYNSERTKGFQRDNFTSYEEKIDFLINQYLNNHENEKVSRYIGIKAIASLKKLLLNGYRQEMDKMAKAI